PPLRPLPVHARGLAAVEQPLGVHGLDQRGDREPAGGHVLRGDLDPEHHLSVISERFAWGREPGRPSDKTWPPPGPSIPCEERRDLAPPSGGRPSRVRRDRTWPLPPGPTIPCEEIRRLNRTRGHPRRGVRRPRA